MKIIMCNLKMNHSGDLCLTKQIGTTSGDTQTSCHIGDDNVKCTGHILYYDLLKDLEEILLISAIM